MIPSLPTSISLLEGALGYTRDQLLRITPGRSGDPTPCAGWSLQDLLEHMDDALDAFLEAAGGAVELRPRPLEPTAADLCTRLQVKACALTDVWRAAARDGRQVVDVAGHRVPAVLLINTAALEITVHGWDVARTLDPDPPRIPVDLARHLRPVTLAVVSPADRGARFGPPVPTTPGTPADQALLAHLGRVPTPGGHTWANRLPDTGAAS
ncbi:TIGR03086 family metal-binding protein [Nocardioides bigeumensis]|uniref:Maleylpyruvate isomerase family mycothiol-dependent enzyme n=1 Tax=Nocardioides bigeumensis TaxID=433657 RepID=A0ABN2YYT9_9ACTN